MFAAYMWLVAFPNTQYPTDIISSQLTFSASTLYSHFKSLIESGTLDNYIYFHRIDFIFIVLYTIVLPFTVIVIARLSKDESNRFWFAVSLLFPAAAVFDFIENVPMLRMLSNPQSFPDWMAIAHSYCALTKLVLFGAGLALLLVASIILAVTKIKK